MVKDIRLEPEELVFYSCPRRKIGRYQKWRRLCTLGMSVRRFNDVLYSVKLSPRSSSIIIHADRLRRYEGETPDLWKAAIQTVTSAADIESSAGRPSVSIAAAAGMSSAGRPSVSSTNIVAESFAGRPFVSSIDAAAGMSSAARPPVSTAAAAEMSFAGRPPVSSTNAVAGRTFRRTGGSNYRNGRIATSSRGTRRRSPTREQCGESATN